VLGVVGIFRLAGGLLESDARTKPAAAVGAWAAAFAYGANPNLIYMQATAMTESLYLALFVWAAVYFAEFIRALNENDRRKLDDVGQRESSPEGQTNLAPRFSAG